MLDVNWLTPAKRRQLVVVGEEGMFELDYLTQRLAFTKGADTANPTLIRGFAPTFEGDVAELPVKMHEPLAAEIDAFLGVVRNGDRPKVDAPVGLGRRHRECAAPAAATRSPVDRRPVDPAVGRVTDRPVRRNPPSNRRSDARPSARHRSDDRHDQPAVRRANDARGSIGRPRTDAGTVSWFLSRRGSVRRHRRRVPWWALTRWACCSRRTASHGWHVTAVDVQEAVVAAINEGRSHERGPGLAEAVRTARGRPPAGDD
jgi:hypothetical protein